MRRRIEKWCVAKKGAFLVAIALILFVICTNVLSQIEGENLITKDEVKFSEKNEDLENEFEKFDLKILVFIFFGHPPRQSLHAMNN